MMKRFKKATRLLGLVVLLFLASVGIGISGGVPVSTPGRKEDTIETTAEAVGSDTAETTLIRPGIKS